MRPPAVSGRQDGESVRAAALAVGPSGAVLGSPGSLQGASARQGTESSSASRRDRSGIDGGDCWRDVGERPQQHDSPRQCDAHRHFRAWESASK